MREETRQDVLSAGEIGTMLESEQSSATEKLVTFDLRFKVKNPALSVGKILVMLHIDLEFQNKYRPTLSDGRSYPLIKRAIYYAAREISSQLGRITDQKNYTDIEKVVSIWIVNEEVPKELRNLDILRAFMMRISMR